jgi:hypothetical protein
MNADRLYRRVVASLALVAFLTVAGCSSSADKSATGVTFVASKTPEAALNTFIIALVKNDGKNLLDTFAITNVATKTDFVKTAKRVRALEPIRGLAPNNSPVFQRLNEAQRAARASTEITGLIYSLLLPPDHEDLLGVFPVDKNGREAESFRDAVNPVGLASLKVEKIVPVVGVGRKPVPKLAQNYAEANAASGCDERREYLVLYRLDGKTFQGAFSAIRYGNDWGLESLAPPLAGGSVGQVVLVTAAEFDEKATELSKNVGQAAGTSSTP